LGKDKKKDCKEEINIKVKIENNIAIAENGSFAGVKLRAAEGGQIAGNEGKNANQGGQIAEDNGKNANQFSEVSCDDEPGAPGATEIEETTENETVTEAAQSTKLWKRWFDK
jgi:hypothetical protein